MSEKCHFFVWPHHLAQSGESMEHSDLHFCKPSNVIPSESHSMGVGGRNNTDYVSIGLPRWPSGKESTCQCRRHRRYRFNPWVRKIPWRREWQSTPVFLPGEFHGGAWWATVRKVTKSRTQMNDEHTHTLLYWADLENPRYSSYFNINWLTALVLQL